MSAKGHDVSGHPNHALHLRQGAQSALRVLETCPFVPVDAFVHLLGLSAPSSAYQQLARLRRAGLAEVSRVNPGYLVGERPLGCWTITDAGSRVLHASDACKTGRAPHKPWRIGEGDAPLLIASYRLLASVVLDSASRETTVAVQQWEWP